MNVLASDTRPNKILSEVLGFEYTSLEDLLARTDIITLHVPYNKYTHHLEKSGIKLFKKGAILINTVGGGIVDTEALTEALDKRILAGTGLDVIEGEELIKEEKQLLYDSKKAEILANLVKDHILLSMDSVVFTPNTAFYSREALERIFEATVNNIAPPFLEILRMLYSLIWLTDIIDRANEKDEPRESRYAFRNEA